MQDTTHIKYDIVGSHMENYDFMIALNHFKGHPMGGYGGALKNLSIGCASQNGKAYIHSAGRMEKLNMMKLWTKYVDDQDGFLESMAAAAQAVTDYFGKKQGIIYISVMNNMSIDCDCVDHPEPVKLEDYGILAHHQQPGGDRHQRPHRPPCAYRQAARHPHHRARRSHRLGHPKVQAGEHRQISVGRYFLPTSSLHSPYFSLPRTEDTPCL